MRLEENLINLLSEKNQPQAARLCVSRIWEFLGAGLSDEARERSFFHVLENGQLHQVQAKLGLRPKDLTQLLASYEIALKYFRLRSQSVREAMPTHPQDFFQRASAKVPEVYRLATYEWLGFVPVYRTRELGEFNLVEKGVRTHVNTEPAELFSRILILRPLGFFLFHNHPSGSEVPSFHDLELTRKVQKTAQELNVPLFKHGIITLHGDHPIELGASARTPNMRKHVHGVPPLP